MAREFVIFTLAVATGCLHILIALFIHPCITTSKRRDGVDSIEFAECKTFKLEVKKRYLVKQATWSLLPLATLVDKFGGGGPALA